MSLRTTNRSHVSSSPRRQQRRATPTGPTGCATVVVPSCVSLLPASALSHHASTAPHKDQNVTTEATATDPDDPISALRQVLLQIPPRTLERLAGALVNRLRRRAKRESHLATRDLGDIQSRGRSVPTGCCRRQWNRPSRSPFRLYRWIRHVVRRRLGRPIGRIGRSGRCRKNVSSDRLAAIPTFLPANRHLGTSIRHRCRNRQPRRFDQLRGPLPT